MAKQKFYKLKGEAENADNLNNYVSYGENFRSKLPKSKPRKPAPTGPSVIERQRGKSLIEKGDIKPVIASTIGKLSSTSSRADSVKAYVNAGKGVAQAEANRIKANNLIGAAYAGQEKGRIARTDATATARNLAIPLAESNWKTPQERESLAKRLQATKK